MLNRLYIKNYALIENLDIHFDRGLNIITGETGAGKSIIMGALGLIRGNRAEGKQFFHADQKCIIEGFFQIESYELQDFFVEHDLDYEALTIIRRELTVEGKSRAFVNDSPVTLAVLRSLGEKLIDIHSQHATLQINTEEFQLLVLDAVAKNNLLMQVYQEKLKSYAGSKKAFEKLKEEIAIFHTELDYNQFLFDELSKANLQNGEQQQLEEEQAQLTHAEEIKRGLEGASNLLNEPPYSITHNLKAAVNSLQQVEKYMSAAAEIAARLQSALIEIKDVNDEINSLSQDLVWDDQRLNTVDERLSELYGLQKKHRVEDVDGLLFLMKSLEEKILTVTNQEEKLAELAELVAKDLHLLMEASLALDYSRREKIPAIKDFVESILSEVGMPNAKLTIDLQLLAEDQFSKLGLNSVSYLFSANKGQELQPIHKVASGGELSRVMLAVKSLIAQSSALPTLVFDEIDTGISGEVALKVGEIMERMAVNMQVFVITHLPQIAARGKSHFKVYKQDDADKTRTHIQLMDTEQRVLEVAQMLSGANPGEAALSHAHDLITKK